MKCKVVLGIKTFSDVAMLVGVVVFGIACLCFSVLSVTEFTDVMFLVSFWFLLPLLMVVSLSAGQGVVNFVLKLLGRNTASNEYKMSRIDFIPVILFVVSFLEREFSKKIVFPLSLGIAAVIADVCLLAWNLWVFRKQFKRLLPGLTPDTSISCIWAGLVFVINFCVMFSAVSYL